MEATYVLTKTITRIFGPALRRSWSLHLTAAILVLPAHGLAQDQDVEAERESTHPLAQRSPFLPSDFSPPEDRRPAPQRPNQEALSNRYEFRGVYQLDGEYRFLISEKRSRDGKWVAENDSNAPYLVQSYDPKSHAITLNHESQTDQLIMERLSPTPEVMPISGAPVIEDPEEAARSRRPPTRRRTTDATTTQPSPRRAPPPPPQWLIERRKQQQQEREARGETSGPSSRPPSSPPPGPPPSGPPSTPPPNFIPGPPPDTPPPGIPR